MTTTHLGKVVASLVASLAVNVMTVQGALTLTLDDGLGHSKSIVDGGAGDLYASVPGVIVWVGPLPGSVWSGIFVGLGLPAPGSPSESQLGLSFQRIFSSGPGELTLTVSNSGMAGAGVNAGGAIMAGRGTQDQGSIFAQGQVNGLTAVELGPFADSLWQGMGTANANALGQPFELSQQVVIIHNDQGRSGGGTFMALNAAVPEPSTWVAGVCLLAPLLIGAVRSLTRRA